MDFLIKGKDGVLKPLKNHKTVQKKVVVKTTSDISVPKKIQSHDLKKNSIRSSKLVSRLSTKHKIKPSLQTNKKLAKSNDDLDVKKYINPGQQKIQSKVKSYTQKQTDDIVSKVGINFVNDKVRLDGRLHSIILTAIKGVRSSVDTKQLLMRPIDKGGLDLKEQLVDILLNLIKDSSKDVEKKQVIIQKDHNTTVEKDKIEQRKDKPTEGLKKIRASYSAQVPYDISKIGETKKTIATKNLPSQISNSAKDLIKQPTQPIEAEVAKVSIKKAQKIRTVKIAKAKPLLVRNESGGMSMVDVLAPDKAMAGNNATLGNSKTIDTRKPKLIGPVGELKYMTVVDYRRLSDDIDQRSNKIVEKINLLEEDSYIKRIEGIQAWQANEVYNLYAKMGYEALLNGWTLDQLIVERQNTKKISLTKDEFYAMIELHKKLSL